MPRRNLLILVAIAATAVLALIVLGVLVASGGDDDDDEANGGSDPTVSVRPTSEPEESPAIEATDDGDKTPGPDETPGATEEPGPTPIQATPNPAGIRATIIEDPTAWFAENYPGVSPGQEDCTYNVATVLVTCGGVDYAPDPPLVGAGAECFGLLVNNERVALRCTIPDVTTYYYDIQE